MDPLTPDQIHQLQSLGIISPPTSASKNHHLLPLLSISGLSLASLAGMIVFKIKLDSPTSVPAAASQPATAPDNAPTQVPKSIQHYLLTSQQLFSQALSAQSAASQADLLTLVNQSISAASSAITDFPSDFRGYLQRGQIYQSLLDSQPQLLPHAISDLQTAFRLNSTSAEICRSLAALYARSGQIPETLYYLKTTVDLEPTRAQNFYDLAQLQEKVGLISDALTTYSRLLTITTDPSQKQQIAAITQTLQKIISSSSYAVPTPLPSPAISPAPSLSGPTLQASTGSRLLIAGPAAVSSVSVSSLTSSNSLSGTGQIPASQSSFSLQNSRLTPSSQVYVSLTKGGKNQLLQVSSRTGDTFTVSLDSPATENTEFKWWIINP